MAWRSCSFAVIAAPDGTAVADDVVKEVGVANDLVYEMD